jgi:hypothetical protein
LILVTKFYSSAMRKLLGEVQSISKILVIDRLYNIYRLAGRLTTEKNRINFKVHSISNKILCGKALIIGEVFYSHCRLI